MFNFSLFHLQDRRAKIQSDIAFQQGILAELQSELDWLGNSDTVSVADAVPVRNVRQRQEWTDEAGEDS